jgi:hypothetical protein
VSICSKDQGPKARTLVGNALHETKPPSVFVHE